MNRLAMFKQMLNPGVNDWASRNIFSEGTIKVTAADVADVLNAYLEGEITYEQLLDWANLALFNDAFLFSSDEVRDCLDRIEESDEPGNELTSEEINNMLKSLSQSQ